MTQVTERAGGVPAVSAGRVDRPTALAAVLLVGLAGACCAHGGFDATGRTLLFGTLVAAAALAMPLMSFARKGLLQRRLLPPAALAGWLLLDSAGHGDLVGGLPSLGLLAGVVLTIGCTRALTADAARLLLTGLLGLGAVVALVGWLGVAAHRSPAAIAGQGLFRAASTFSYPNATGAFLAVTVLLGVALLAGAPASDTGARGIGALVAVALTGLAATLSRGAVLALLGGLLVLLVALGPRLLLRVAGYPLLGGCLGAAALLPAAPVTARPEFPLALLGLLLAAGVGTLSPGRRRPAWLPYLLMLAGAASAAILHPLPAIGHARLTVSSDDRWAALHAVGQVIGRAPLTGAGPRLRTLSWHPATGGVQIFRFAHNEYLQVTAEFGLVGLVLMLGCLAGLVRMLRRRWPVQRADRPLPAAAAAIVVAVLISVSLDFTGHFPALVLTAAAVVGRAMPACRHGH